MGNLTSTLTMKLIDLVTAPAMKVGQALKGMDTAARRAQGSKIMGAATGTPTAMMAGGSRFLVNAVGAYVTATAAKQAYVDAANFDRRMTRIGITAEATKEQMKSLKPTIMATSNEIGMSFEDVTSGIEALVAQGRSLPEAMAFLPSVARTAQASGAAVDDMANTAGAIGDSMKIPAQEMQNAFDILAMAGKAGKFELRDMAKELPSIAPMAAAIGLKGTEGLKKLAAMLQIIRNQTGTAGEAATAMTNVLQKMETEETSKKFQKFGKDLRGTMAKARKDGKDLLEVFMDLSEEAVQGDLSKIPQLFTDLQFGQGMRALLSQRQQLRALIAELAKAQGTVVGDLAKVANDSASGIERLSNSWKQMLQSLGTAADTAGASSFLKYIGREADATAKNLQDLAAIAQLLKEGKYGEAGAAAAKMLGEGGEGGYVPNLMDLSREHERKIRAPKDAKEVQDQKDIIADTKRRIAEIEAGKGGARAASTLARLRETLSDAEGRLRILEDKARASVTALLPDITPLPPLAGDEAFKAMFADKGTAFHAARAAQARKTARPRYPAPRAKPDRFGVVPLDDATPYTGPDVPLARARFPAPAGTSAIDAAVQMVAAKIQAFGAALDAARINGPNAGSQAQRFPPSGPPTIAPVTNVAPPAEPVQVPGVMSSFDIDDAAVGTGAAEALAKAQAYFDAHPPVIRPRVEMPRIPNISGGGVADGANGSHSDTTQGRR